MYRLPTFVVTGLVFVGVAAPAVAQSTPLRFIPNQSDLVFQVPQPRKLVEAVLNHPLTEQVRKLDAVAEAYDSTNYRRFLQLVNYFEKELNADWAEALDKIAGGGMVVASKFGKDPAPALFVMQAKDESVLKRFVQSGLAIIDQELARQESKDRRRDSNYRGIATVHFGAGFHAAVHGAALVVSNQEKVLNQALDLQLNRAALSMATYLPLAEAQKLLPANPLSTLWVNLEPAHKAPNAKDVFDLPNNQPLLTVVFGGIIDVVKRAPYVCVGSYREGDGFLTRVRMPMGRDGMPNILQAHVPPQGQVGALPLLEPKGVLLSSSYFLDVSKFWQYRAQLVNSQQLPSVEEFDKNSGRFLLGNKLSKLLSEIGSHQRFVAVNQQSAGYTVQPNQRIPAFALVTELREPATFGKSMEAILRGAGFIANLQAQLKLVEEKHGDYKIIGYRFPETAKVKGDTERTRFNFSPCFVTVGDQFIASSTIELCHELIDLVKKEPKATSRADEQQLTAARKRLEAVDSLMDTTLDQLAGPKDPRRRSALIRELADLDQSRAKLVKTIEGLAAAGANVKGMPAAIRTQLYAKGGAEALQLTEDQLLAQTILNQALPPTAARAQVKQGLELLRKLGLLRLETEYTAKDFRLDIRLMPQSK